MRVRDLELFVDTTRECLGGNPGMNKAGEMGISIETGG